MVGVGGGEDGGQEGGEGGGQEGGEGSGGRREGRIAGVGGRGG